MWLFGKKISISNLMKDEETEDSAVSEDLSFAPEIERRGQEDGKKDAQRARTAKESVRRAKTAEEAARGKAPAEPAPRSAQEDETFDAPDEEQTKALFGNLDLFDDLDRVVNEDDVTGIMTDDIFTPVGKEETPVAASKAAEEPSDAEKDARGSRQKDAAPAEKTAPTAAEKTASATDKDEIASPSESARETAEKKEERAEAEDLSPFSPDLFAEGDQDDTDELSRIIAGIVNKDQKKAEQTIILPAEEFYSLFEEKGASVDARETPEEVFERLIETPYTARTYALYEDRMYLSCSDGEGKLYLFEEFGEYKRVQPGDCKVFVKLPFFGGAFRGKSFKTADLEYIMQQHAMKLTASAYTPEEQEALKLDGYLPEKRSETGRGRQFSKSVSLYRMKDLYVRADVTTTFPVLLGESYHIALQRSDLEEVDCEKQFKKLCRRIVDCILGLEEEPFFNLQVLKVRRNIAVCFPMEGTPAEGDLFAGGEINALAQTDDGSYIIQVGQDDRVKLPLQENKTERGQHRIILPALL